MDHSSLGQFGHRVRCTPNLEWSTQRPHPHPRDLHHQPLATDRQHHTPDLRRLRARQPFRVRARVPQRDDRLELARQLADQPFPVVRERDLQRALQCVVVLEQGQQCAERLGSFVRLAPMVSVGDELLPVERECRLGECTDDIVAHSDSVACAPPGARVVHYLRPP